MTANHDEIVIACARFGEDAIYRFVGRPYLNLGFHVHRAHGRGGALEMGARKAADQVQLAGDIQQRNIRADALRELPAAPHVALAGLAARGADQDALDAGGFALDDQDGHCGPLQDLVRESTDTLARSAARKQQHLV